MDLVSFRKARGAARRAVRQAKNTWFQERAAVIEKGGFGGKDVWQAICDIQRSRHGLVPSRAVAILFDEDRAPCTSTEAQHQHWKRHFTKVLNVDSSFVAAEMGMVQQ